MKHDSAERDRITVGKTFQTVTRDVRMWSTPLRTDSKFCLTTGKFTNIVSEAQAFSDGSTTSRLNPAWAETLMGWPAGWTSTEAKTALAFEGFPKGQGIEQHPYEPPRTVHKDDCTYRAKRIAMVGNGVVPQQVSLAYERLLGFKIAEERMGDTAATHPRSCLSCNSHKSR